MKTEINGVDNIINFVIVRKTLKREDRNIEDLEKVLLDEIEKLEEATNIYLSENGIRFLKTEFPGEWNYGNKNLAFSYE